MFQAKSKGGKGGGEILLACFKLVGDHHHYYLLHMLTLDFTLTRPLSPIFCFFPIFFLVVLSPRYFFFYDLGLLSILLYYVDGDLHINFEEFLSGISMMCEDGEFAEKVQFSFQVYDFDGDGKIGVDELTDMLKASLAETDLDMTDEELNILVNATLKQVSGSDASSSDGSITYDQYMQYAQLNRERFQSAMTVNIKQRIARSSK